MRTPRQTRPGWLEWLGQTLDRLSCWHQNTGLRGDGDRLVLRCLDCDKSWPGWHCPATVAKGTTAERTPLSFRRRA